MKRSQRIGYNRYYDDGVFAKHLDFVKRNIDAIDEVWLFAEYSHYGYWPIEDSKKTASIIEKRIPAYKSAGVKSVGINVLCTIGHVEEGWDVLPKAPYQYVTGRDGKVSASCLCPSGDDYLEYVSERYKVFAKTNPDFIYVDDDIRVENHGISDVCYCDNCISRFNREYGHSFDRKALVNAIDSDRNVLIEWNSFRKSVITKIMVTVEKAVHSVNPEIKIGLMTTPGHEDILPKWMEAGKCVMGRPGGGYYNDDKPLDFLAKCNSIEPQIDQYPDSVTDIQYEFEDFNYITLNKSMCISALECTTALFVGCNGIAFNDLVMDDKPELMQMIRENTPLWEQISKICKNTQAQGVFCANGQVAFELQKTGFPVTPHLEDACAYVVLGYEWAWVDEATRLKILSGAVLTDGEGLKWLCDNGYSEYTGGKPANSYTNGMAQRFTDHKINGAYKNYYRDVFMTFFHPSTCCYDFKPDGDAEVLANSETITHIPGAPSMYVYKNSLGGYIAVDGYLQPDSLNSEAKRLQLHNLLQYMTNDGISCLVCDYKKIVTFTRKDENGNLAILLINASFDESGEFALKAAIDGNAILLDNSGERKLQVNNGIVSIPNMKPWHSAVLTDIQL